MSVCVFARCGMSIDNQQIWRTMGYLQLSLALSMSWRYGTISDAGAGGYLLFDDDDDDDKVEEVERGRCEEGTS